MNNNNNNNSVNNININRNDKKDPVLANVGQYAENLNHYNKVGTWRTEAETQEVLEACRRLDALDGGSRRHRIWI